jgi:argininosuccinate synthase
LFANEYILPQLKANALYEGKYPLASALSRPLIAQLLVQVANQEGAVAVAHGCTGKGNDQVRFDVSIAALNPDLQIIAPVREWGMTRDEEIAYAKAHNIPIPVDLDNPFSIDQNMWGRANECGVLEDPWAQPPEEAYELTAALEKTPDQPDVVTITFEKGKPTAIDGRQMALDEIILYLNQLAGKHGVGRIDHVENRLVGIKSREIYEAPAAVTLIKAHQELEHITLTREVAHFKPIIEQKLTDLVYEGLWFSPLKQALDAFVEETQQTVSGEVRVKLFKGNATIVGRRSAQSLYNKELATYGAEDTFDHMAAIGFIKLWGLPTKVNAQVNLKTVDQLNVAYDMLEKPGAQVGE